MAYGDFLNNIEQKFEHKFNEMAAVYNFEKGHEFEIVLCKVLRSILPNKYGICRGYVVTMDGTEKGDDIIIYDKEHFPLLRLLDDITFEQKQKVPVEAVYAYIEAKHTLYIEGQGGQSLDKAIKQCCEVISLKRKPVSLSQINSTFEMPINMGTFSRDNSWPQIQNPIFGMIISKNLKLNKQDKGKKYLDYLKDNDNISRLFEGTYASYPSVVIASKDLLFMPVSKKHVDKPTLTSPFHQPPHSELTPVTCENNAFTIGICMLLYAIENIQLGKIAWPYVIGSALTTEDVSYD